MHLLLVRHGQTPANVLGQLDTGVPGAPLTELGGRQAAAIPQGLEARGLPLPERISVSTLLRTQLTAAPLATSLGQAPNVLDGLKEIQAGDLEMLSDKESQGLYTATTLAWARGELDVRMPGGETGRAFVERFDEAILQAVSGGGDTVAVVSHGAAIRVWVAARAAGAADEFAATHQLLNTGLAHLESLPAADEDGLRWRLVTWVREPTGGAFLEDDAADDPTGRDTADPATAPGADPVAAPDADLVAAPDAGPGSAPGAAPDADGAGA
jgi:broad specificity phosphatase PhoE